jgi:hypothetical protein
MLDIFWNLLYIQDISYRTSRRAPLLLTREAPRSSLVLETDYPDWDFSYFSSAPLDKCRGSTLD